MYSTSPDSEDVREAMAGELRAAQKMAECVDDAGEHIALQVQQYGDLTEARRAGGHRECSRD